MKRVIDILISVLLIILTILPMMIIAITIKISSKGPIIYWSKRVGRNNKIFWMPKFRSMKFDTEQVATHLLKNPNDQITKIGRFIRKYSLDELPQLVSILIGDMSIVGPRPALFNQFDLIDLRTSFEIQKLRPGLTGWAQINGRDNLSIEEKVNFDKFYLDEYSIWLDIKIIFLTFFNAVNHKNVSY